MRLHRLLLKQKDKGTAGSANVYVGKAQTHAAIRTGVEMNLFEKVAEDDVAARSNAQLAAMTGADPVLLSIFQSLQFGVDYSPELRLLVTFSLPSGHILKH